jgi:hypothetical protein
MRSIQLHPLSLFAGFAVAVVAVVAMGQSTQPAQPTALRPYSPLPHIAPSAMVRIKQGTVYQVPVGKYFVLTALGSQGVSNTDAYFLVNGSEEVVAFGTTVSGGGSGNGTTMKLCPPGLAVPAGSYIEVINGTTTSLSACAWGYLADA